MRTIKYNNNNEIVINKSRFITYMFKISSLKEIDELRKKVKKEQKDATHHCYAYIFENKKKYSDDNEPLHTAGVPILSVLEKKDLSNILCIVVRYFGGKKLGSGGLIRAYRKSTIKCLEKNKIIKLKKGFICEITFNYENINDIEYILNKEEIIEKKFDKDIAFKIKINKEKVKLLKKYNLIQIKEVYL